MESRGARQVRPRTPPRMIGASTCHLNPSVVLTAVFHQEVARRNAPARAFVDHPDFESVSAETEVPLDDAHQPLDRGITTDRAPATARAVGAKEPGLVTLLVGTPQGALEVAPMGLAQLANHLLQVHEPPPPK